MPAGLFFFFFALLLIISPLPGTPRTLRGSGGGETGAPGGRFSLSLSWPGSGRRGFVRGFLLLLPVAVVAIAVEGLALALFDKAGFGRADFAEIIFRLFLAFMGDDEGMAFCKFFLGFTIPKEFPSELSFNNGLCALPFPLSRTNPNASVASDGSSCGWHGERITA